MSKVEDQKMKDTVASAQTSPSAGALPLRVELLCEDRSGGLVLQRLTECIVRRHTKSYNCYLRPHRGCGYFSNQPEMKPQPYASGLCELLPAKLRAYDHVYAGTATIIVVCMDSDSNDPGEIFNKLRTICRTYGPGIRTVIAVSVEEMESWMLADQNALTMAYPEADLDILKSYEQDSICGTWEVLCDVVLGEQSDRIKQIGYPAVGQYKAKWAEKISPYMLPEHNVSPSFKKFEVALDHALQQVLAE